MIEVKNLVKRYGSHLAVDHLNFTVESGQIYGFLGPNGAGKSTTMNIMTGYLGATEGEVLVNGHNILEEPEEAKRSIGYLPEIPPLYLDMTVKEYLDFAAELKKVKKKDRKSEVEKVIQLVKLEEVEGRLIKNLSKGYKQRVGLAQAVLGFPEVIILDEPTVGLDPKQIIEIRELIKELSKNHTIILSSHILAEVQAVCDYVMIIAHGKLVASDTPENLERLLNGSETIELTTRAKEARVREILENVEEIENAEYKEQPDGTTDISIKTTEQKDIREKLFHLFAEENCPLLKLNLSRITLEDVFLKLTQDETRNSERKSSGWNPEKSDTELKEEADMDLTEVYEESLQEDPAVCVDGEGGDADESNL
nr:ATP-binding cassette domain-containing protein [uncultured Faecalimonas sp.]